MSNLDNIPAMLDAMAAQLAGLISRNGLDNPAMVGIHSGGVWIAEQLYRRMSISEPLGSLDISSPVSASTR